MAVNVTAVTDANTAFTSSAASTVDFLELRGTNGPDGRVFQLIQFNGGGGYGWQIALGTDHYELYKRHCAGGVWTPWTRFWPPLRIVGGVISKLLSEVMTASGGRHDEYHPEAESAETRHVRMETGAHSSDAYRNISVPNYFQRKNNSMPDMGRRYGILPIWGFSSSGNEQLRPDGRHWLSVGTFCDLLPVMAKEVA